jgi:hypothetical protein
LAAKTRNDDATIKQIKIEEILSSLTIDDPTELG